MQLQQSNAELEGVLGGGMDGKGRPNLPLAAINYCQQWEQEAAVVLGWCCWQHRESLKMGRRGTALQTAETREV